ncbi:hypothetical protein JW998_08705 [candidate division KSB1 bacterium]|nr:hypothetical protein [candidate division KSB1 bacterium]
MHRTSLAFFTLCVTLTRLELSAQDSHYWTSKYGTESILLGGAVVGSHLDISSTFYNPGALGITKNPAFVMTGWVFNLTSLNYESAVGEKSDMGTLRFSPAPDYVTGLIPTALKSKLAYSLLTRYKFQERLVARDSFRKDVLDRPGDELFAGEYYLDQDLVESWFGLSWSKALSPTIGFGLTSYIAYRSQKMYSAIVNEAFSEAKTAATTTVIRHFNYYNYRALCKIGIAIDLSPLTFGAALTTPSVNVFGNGATFVNRMITDQTIPGYAGQDFVDFDEQKNKKSNYRSPLSISAGGSLELDSATIHASAEWFRATGEINVLQTVPYRCQSSGEIAENAVIQDLKSVVNVGIGIQRHFTEQFELYASFVSDVSAAKPSSRANVSITSWNIYHLMAGALLRLWRSEVTAGIGYSFGSENFMQKVDFDTAHEKNLLLGERREKRGIYRNATFLVGFSIFPSELLQKTIESVPFLKKDKKE